MGNLAIVAFRNSEGTYDLHRSPDGATNYQLLFPLSVAATSDDTGYRDVIAALDAPEATLGKSAIDHQFLANRAARGEVRAADGDPETLLEANPFETDVGASSLMEYITPEAQHLYVVSDDLELYYPAWGSIGLLTWFQNTLRIEAYDRTRVQRPEQVEALADRRPDHTFERNDFGELVETIEPTSERYTVFRDHFQTIGAKVSRDAFEYEQDNTELSRVRVLHPDWMFVITPIGKTISPPTTVSRAIYPIHVPFDEADSIEDVGMLMEDVRQTVSDAALYIDGMMLATDMPVEQEHIRGRGGEMFIDRLQETYPTRFKTEYLPFD